MTVTTKSSSDGPDAKTFDEFEQIGRPLETDGTAPRLLQIGSRTLPLALLKPVVETISQALPPTEMFPLGLLTVTEQPAPEFWVTVPPGQLCNVATTTLVMWNVSSPDGQPELQMMLPLALTPVTNPPVGHIWPAQGSARPGPAARQAQAAR